MAFAVEPGYRLAGRYRLLRPAAGLATPLREPAPPGAGRPVLAPPPLVAHWCGHDEMLNRTVGVRVLPVDDPVADDVLAAARRAAALDDPRFLAVLDADRWDGLAYVVTEWVDARDLTSLLAAGPLTDLEAQGLVAELARALSVAHAGGLTHGRLLPENVLVTDAGRLKIAGLAVAAAAHPHGDADEGVRDDVRGAGAVLYAALTARWPLDAGAGETALAPAPSADGEPCTPRQVRAAVPADLDDLVCRALGVHLRRHAHAFASVRELAELLPYAGGSGESSTGPLPVVPADPGLPLLASPARPGAARRAVALAVGCVLAGATGLLGYQVAAGLPDGDPAPSAAAPATPEVGTPTPPGMTPAGIALPVHRVTAFDPQGDGTEHDDRAELAADGDLATSWTTQVYYNDPLGGLKEGVGVVVDLGTARSVGAVALDLVGEGSDVQLRAAQGLGDDPPADPSAYRTVAEVAGAGESTTLSPQRPARARWLLLWFTDLPEIAADEYRGGVTEIAVRS